MAWNDQGNGKSPWDPNKNQPPDLDQIVEEWQKRFNKLFGMKSTGSGKKPRGLPEDTKHDRKSEKGKVTEAMTATPPAYSSSEAQKHVDRDVTIMSKFIGKASQQVIKTMMDGVKSGRYDAMDLQRGIQSGPVKRTHYGELDFIQQLWRKVRDGFRRYSKDRKLR